MTDADRKRAERERKAALRASYAEAGLERVEVWVKPEWKDFVRALAKLLNEWKQ